VTPQQNRLMRFLQAQHDLTGVCPTIRECATALQMTSLGTVYALLERLERDGYIKRDTSGADKRSRPRGMTIMKRLGAWRPINTLPDSDDPVWLYNVNSKSLEGPRASKDNDCDRFDYWAPCTPPSPLPSLLQTRES
jgi:SOS-response transcriptional repressor LexA